MRTAMRRSRHEGRPPTQAAAAPGKKIAAPVRGRMEAHFQHDFGDVRVHTDTAAASSAAAHGALAYTMGDDIHFAANRYQPDTTAGRALLAHELTHVAQQRELGHTLLQRRPVGGGLGDDLEREAEFMAAPFDSIGPGRDLDAGSAPFNRTALGGTLPYREAMANMVPPRPRPAAAKLRDTRTRVQPGDVKLFKDLSTYVAGLAPRLRKLAAAGHKDEPWLRTDNPNVMSALRLLDKLVVDMAHQRFVVRFDKPASGDSAASYDLANNQMSLRRYSGNERRTIVASSLLHEYAHVIQDREAERLFATRLKPRAATAAEDLEREIEARREEVYFSEMLRVLGEPVPTDEIFGAQLTARVFRGQFERERTAGTAKERQAATKEIREKIEKPYRPQLERHARIKHYVIELDTRNHALLHWDLAGKSTPRDLGHVPVKLENRQQLTALLAARVSGLAEFARLFDRPGSDPFKTLLITVAFDRESLGSFAVER